MAKLFVAKLKAKTDYHFKNHCYESYQTIRSETIYSTAYLADDFSHMTGNGISLRVIKDSLVTLHIQR
jgi:hypothetical protein